MKQYAIKTLSVIGIIFLGLFGVNILNNIHNLYLRELSTWTVKITNQEGNSGATGFVVKGKSGEKYIMTNNHVCNLAQNGMLTANYRGEQFQVNVYKRYEFNDLCALKAHRKLGPAVKIASSVSLGENTWVIGHPLLEPRSVNVGELSGTVFVPIIMGVNVNPEECKGSTYNLITPDDGSILSAFGIQNICYRLLEANASTMSIQPGNSGSPATNVYGHVVAVAFAANQAGTRSYFVPLSDLRDFVDQL